VGAVHHIIRVDIAMSDIAVIVHSIRLMGSIEKAADFGGDSAFELARHGR
jgi:hypothetical protein